MAAGDDSGRPRLELAEEAETAEAEGDEIIIEAIKEAGLEADEDGAFHEEDWPPESDLPSPSFVAVQADEQPQPERQVHWTKKELKKKAEDSATWLLLIMDGAAVVALGEEARMTREERKMIEEPLARIMQRMKPEVLQQMEIWTDPILLAFGLLTWGGRLYAISRDRADDNDPPDNDEPHEPEPSPHNGTRRQAEREEGDAAILEAGPPTELLEQVSPLGGLS